MSRNKKLLKDIAYEKIREKILKEDDDYTSENLLVEELKMSRTPIREALKRLEHEGFIKIFPNQGISIPDLSIKEMNDIMDYRIAIETASLKQAIGLLTPDDFETLDQFIQKQKEAYQQNDPLRYLHYDVEFHLYLIKVVGNPLFIQAIDHVCHRLYRIHRRMKSNPKLLYTRLLEHVRIIEMLRGRQIDFAVKQLEDHLNGGKSYIF